MMIRAELGQLWALFRKELLNSEEGCSTVHLHQGRCSGPQPIYRLF